MDFPANTPASQTGIGPSGNYVPPANTPSPYNESETGLVDGTGVNSASRNMAWVYNAMYHELISTIKSAGIVPDKDNWAQLQAAIKTIASNQITNAPDVFDN